MEAGGWRFGIDMPLLTLSWVVPLAGALLLLLVPNADGRRDGLIRWLALAFSLVSFAVTIALCVIAYGPFLAMYLPARLVSPGFRLF